MTVTNYTPEQVMLTLSFIADIGATIEAGDCEMEHQLYGSITKLLQSYPTVQDSWDLVWGPCVFKFPLIAKYRDNTFFIVRSRQDTSQYVIVLSGTNPFEITDWVFEDFLVADTAPWQYGTPPPGAKISLSAALSLSILQGVKPCAGIPGAGQRLISFLKDASSGGGVSSVTVTGHSLGGEMASTVALWLADTQGGLWDAQKSVNINAYTYAAPTAGNAQWAGYYDARLGANTQRIWNPLDVVPYDWNIGDMEKVPYLYLPDILPPFWVAPFIANVIWWIRDKNYAQINAGQPALAGSAVNLFYPEFIPQMMYQHVLGYVELLQLPSMTSLIDTLSAQARPAKML